MVKQVKNKGDTTVRFEGQIKARFLKLGIPMSFSKYSQVKVIESIMEMERQQKVSA